MQYTYAAANKVITWENIPNNNKKEGGRLIKLKRKRAMNMKQGRCVIIIVEVVRHFSPPPSPDVGSHFNKRFLVYYAL